MRQRTNNNNEGDVEEYGLVPQKYLMRKTKSTMEDASNNTSNSAAVMNGKDKSHQQPQQHQTPPPFWQVDMDDPHDPPVWMTMTKEEKIKRLQQLDQALAKRQIGGDSTTTNNNNKYNSSDTAADMDCSSFVKDWKIMTLRSEKYNVSKATSRAISHWKCKSELFGTPDLKVTLSGGGNDLDSELISTGLIQLVPVRDLAQRAIVCIQFIPELYAKQEREFRKYLFYMLATAMEDVDTQDNGIVLVVWNTHQATSLSNNSPWGGFFDSFWSLWNSIRGAFWISRLHYCIVKDNNTHINSPHLNMVNGNGGNDTPYTVKERREYTAGGGVGGGMGIMVGGGNNQTNSTLIRQHQGSSQECLHALLTVGIPVGSLFISIPPHDDSSKTIAKRDKFRESYFQWLQWRYRTDSYHPISDPQQQHPQQWPLILVPNRQDILFGKYATVNSGNVKFHQLIASNVENYKESNETGKATIRKQIYTTLCHPTASTGAAKGDDDDDNDLEQKEIPHAPPVSRFLQPVEPKQCVLWEPMNEAMIDTKIARAFDYVSRQLENVAQSTKQSGGTIQRASDLWEFGDILLSTQQCFHLMTCQRGYHVCEDATKLPTFWQNPS